MQTGFFYVLVISNVVRNLKRQSNGSLLQDFSSYLVEMTISINHLLTNTTLAPCKPLLLAVKVMLPAFSLACTIANASP